MLHSYPKIYNLGHPAIAELFSDSVIVEEKIDGSQFSFGLHSDKLFCRSRKIDLVLDGPLGMFEEAVGAVKKIADQLPEGYTFRGEYLKKPKHNGLAYDRIPQNHIMIFDIERDNQDFMKYLDKFALAKELGFECVPLLFSGVLTEPSKILHLMNRTSVLGGQLIEGLVFKNDKRFGRDGKVLRGKHVSEEFKEVQRKEWKKDNKAGKDILQLIGEQYKTEARWNKAIQHLKERNELENSPKDIGILLKEVNRDIEEECAEEIKDKLYKWARKDILRMTIRGLPEWYKQKLLEKQFEGEQI